MNTRDSVLCTARFLLAALLCISAAEVLAQGSTEPTPITISEVVSASIAPSIPAAGTVFSRNESQITAGMAGRLRHVAEPGDYVEAGAPVAVFDCEMLKKSSGWSRMRANACSLSLTERESASTRWSTRSSAWSP